MFGVQCSCFSWWFSIPSLRRSAPAKQEPLDHEADVAPHAPWKQAMVPLGLSGRRFDLRNQSFFSCHPLFYTLRSVRPCVLPASAIVLCFCCAVLCAFCFQAVELTASQNLSQKRTGYLTASLTLSPNHEFRFMLVNQMQRDLASPNMLEAAAALTALCKLGKTTIKRERQRERGKQGLGAGGKIVAGAAAFVSLCFAVTRLSGVKVCWWCFPALIVVFRCQFFRTPSPSTSGRVWWRAFGKL